MTKQWLDKPDNPGLSQWDLSARDVFGAVFLVNFADRLYKAGITFDFHRSHPVAQLADFLESDEISDHTA